jgi:hypothetical protein
LCEGSSVPYDVFGSLATWTTRIVSIPNINPCVACGTAHAATRNAAPRLVFWR